MSVLENKERTLFVVGAGIVSLPLVEEFIRYHTGPGPAARLVWITGGRQPGESQAFEPIEAVPQQLTLNQPTIEMGVSRGDTESYAKWVKQNSGISDPRYAFTKRPLFGKFARDYAGKLLQTAERIPSLTIEVRPETVTSILPTHDGKFDVSFTEGNTLHADRGAIAVGPAPSGHLAHLRGKLGYIDSPTDSFALRALAKTSDRESIATIYGSASSMVDAVRLLESLDYKGKYHVIGHTMNFWPCEPEKEDLQNPNRLKEFKFEDETLQHITNKLAEGTDVHSALRSFYLHEVKSKPHLGFHHVLNAFPRKQVADHLRGIDCEKAAGEVEAYHAHVCAPDTIPFLTALKKKGRFIFTKAEIQEVTPANSGKGFHLQAKDIRYYAQTLINAVPFTKGVGAHNHRSALFNTLIEGGFINVDSSNIILTDANSEAMPGLAVVGAASHQGANWGVVSFRDAAHAAGLAAAEALRRPSSAVALPKILPLPPQHHTNQGAAHVHP